MAEGEGRLARELADAAVDARRRTLALVADLDDEQMMGPNLAIVNPPLWEIGHVGWFQEFWNLRYRGEGLPPRPSRIGDRADRLYNSAEIAHDDRWDVPLVARRETFGYLEGVLADVLARLEREGLTEEAAYFMRLATFHEDMHGEAFTWTRQTHALSPPGPATDGAGAVARPAGPLPGDIRLPGGELTLGAGADEEFAFDNELPAHRVEVASFRIARAAVTNAELAAFAADGGYLRRELWSDEGWGWRSTAGIEAPAYWSRDGTGAGWQRRRFDRVEPVPAHEPAIHVCWWEAQAFCRWARRRLPTEAEWELAAAAELSADGGALTGAKRRYPWGDGPPTPERANLDGRAIGPLEVGALPAGDTPSGLRQMMGNVWELCADAFRPYPGFQPGPYREYSEPWFGTHKTMRGGAWPTRGRLLRNTWRNFAEPHRRDLFSGLRTCALEP